MATLVAGHLRHNVVKTGEGKEGEEYVITRLNHIRPALNIVNIYGENEKRAGAIKILESWLRLMKDLEEMKRRGEMILLIRAPDKFKPFKPYLKTIQILADNLG